MEGLCSLTDLFQIYWMSWDVSKVFSVGENIVLSDEELVRQIQKGKKELFEQLVERYSQKMYRYMYHYFNFQ
ncbi:MAG: hypothetical protein GXP45_00815 [bacterium]|nr:hypothetical protein [bacterium]